MLKSLDIVVGLKAHLWRGGGPWSYERLADLISISTSQAYLSLRRLDQAGLFRSADRSLRTHAFAMFAEYGIPHAFPAEVGAEAMGMPTAHAAPPLHDQIAYAEAYVWPTGAGVVGRSVAPLHPTVPRAAAADPQLYQAMALLDAFRVGRARERQLAKGELARLLAEPQRDARWLLARHAGSQVP